MKKANKQALQLFTTTMLIWSLTQNTAVKAETGVCLPLNEQNTLDGTDQCKNTFNSVCSLGDTFANKVIEFDKAYYHSLFMNDKLRKDATAAGQQKGNEIILHFQSLRTTLFKDVSDTVFERWTNYLARIIPITERVRTFTENYGYGFCGEAARTSVIESLFNQLETGTREKVQIILLKGKGPLAPEASHGFALYNSQLIPNQNLNNAQLEDLFKTLNPANPSLPVAVCDSWGDFHDEAKNWFSEFNKDKSHRYKDVKWSSLEAWDCSLPSLREGLNPKQRNYLKDLIKDILSAPRKIAKNHFSM